MFIICMCIFRTEVLIIYNKKLESTTNKRLSELWYSIQKIVRQYTIL